MGITSIFSVERKATNPSSENPIQKLDIVSTPPSISFGDGTCTGCVGVIDMVNSTTTTAPLCKEKMAKYYSLFINSTAAIVRSFGGVVVKNIGDGILYYFPYAYASGEDNRAFAKELGIWLECSLALVNFHDDINLNLTRADLPKVNYRVSLDYGEVYLAKSDISLSEDIFGTTVNICAKINKMAGKNGIAIGGDLHEISKNFEDYDFQFVGSYDVGFRSEYPVYSLQRKERKNGRSGK